MEIFRSIAERKIEEAMEQGLFDDLPGKGKPLVIEDLPGVPEELRMGFKILKDAGVLPEEMALKQSVARLRDLVDACADEDTRHKLRRVLRDQEMRYNILMERNRRGPR
jgi:DnaJ-like protein